MSTSLDTKHYPVTHSDAEWRKILTPEQYHIMREHGTERPGLARSITRSAPARFPAPAATRLFASKTKFESGTGWPSFNDPVPGAVETSTDDGYS